jgi:Ca-activated chloride channel family protein
MALGGRLDQAKVAIRQVADSLEDSDRVGLIRFADESVEWVSTFDDSRAAFYQRLASLQAGGETALYDAMAAAATLVDDERPGRKAIVLVTDGADNASSIPQLEATWMARRVSLPIYTLGFVPVHKKLLPFRLRESLRVLGRFSEETGGTLVPIHEPRDLERAAKLVSQELKYQYVIGFYVHGTPRDGSYRNVSLATRRDGLSVRTRRGYYDNP